MKHLIATLSVYLDTEDTENSSFEKQTGDKTYVLELHPNADKQLTESELGPLTAKQVQTILSHELGHFVGELGQDMTHNKLFRLLYGNIPAEKRAWEFSKDIYPEQDARLEKFALQTYAGEK